MEDLTNVGTREQAGSITTMSKLENAASAATLEEAALEEQW